MHHHVESFHVDSVDGMGTDQVAIPEGQLAVLEGDHNVLAGQTVKCNIKVNHMNKTNGTEELA